MKKAIRFFSLALALLMLLPMLSVFPIKVRATEQTYDASRDGELLRTVNFAADEWKQSFYDGNDSNHDAVASVSDDGASVGFTVTSNLCKRAIWGGFYPGAGVDVDEYEEALGEALPMETGAKYTMTFDLTLGHDNVSFGIMVDGNNALSIRGNGQSRWYEWNTVRVDNTSVENEKWTKHIAGGTTKRDTHTFAVTVDYDAKTMALYVLDENDGRFYFCRSMTYDGADVWDSDYFRCRFYVRSMYGTPTANTTATVSDLTIYKGIVFDVARFSVMSYNIEVNNHNVQDGWEGRTPEKALNTVLCEAPDVVGFQEVNHEWDPMLSTFAALGGYTRLTGEYTSEYEFEKNEIFYKTSKFDLISEGTKSFRQTAIDLNVPNTENANQSLDTVHRIFHYAVLQEKTSGKRFLVVNAHLYYGATGSGAEEHDKVRRYEIRTLLAWLATQTANYPNQIVLGDMNAYFNSPNGGMQSMSIFADGGFERTAATAEVKGDVGGTTTGSARTERKPWVFDYVLTKGNVETAYYTVVNNKIDNGETSYPSDHLPVLTKLIVN